MRKVRIWIGLFLLVGVAALLQMSCGSSSTPGSKDGGPVGPPTGSGSVFLTGGDAPVCDILSFKVTITGATLGSSASNSSASLISSSSPVTVDFARLMDFATYLNLGSAPAGTYQTLTLTLANPQMTVLDVSKTPPSPLQIPTTLSSSNVSVKLGAPLVVSSGGTVGLSLDFNLLKSIQVDASGQVTGMVNPDISAGPSTPAASSETEDVAGIVQSVSTQSNSAFIGSLTINNDDGKSLTVYVPSESVIKGASGLSAIQPGTFVEMNLQLSASGAVAANEIDVEMADTGKTMAFAGYIVSVVRNASDSAQQFVMMVRAEYPSPVASLSLLSLVRVDVSGSTQFGMASQSTNVGGLTYSAATMGAGQEVVVHGPIPISSDGGSSSASTMTASAVYLRQQSLLGTFQKLLTGSSADNTQGGFTFVPCEPLMQKQSMPVFTFEQTQFNGVSGLNQLSPTAEIVVKGLLFYTAQPQSINGIDVQAPTMLLEASGVEQLP
jgi:Domain of unknown function (DUF4382)/Domain of unknown function (DUF5666)